MPASGYFVNPSARFRLPPERFSYQSDDFVSGGASSALGALGWTSVFGAVTFPGAEAGRPGIIRQSTSATINTNARLYLYPHTTLGGFVGTETFDMTFLARLNTNDANTLVRVGAALEVGSNPPTNGVYFEKLEADTNWFRVTRAASVETRVDTGVAVSTTWATFRLRRIDAATIGFTINGGPEQTHATNNPSAGLNPFIEIRNAAAADKTLDLDFFDLLITQLAR